LPAQGTELEMGMHIDQAGEEDCLTQIPTLDPRMPLCEDHSGPHGLDAGPIDEEGSVTDRGLVDRKEVRGSEEEHATPLPRADATTPRLGQTPLGCSY